MYGPIGDAEWARFSFYANFVRTYRSFGERIDGVTSAMLMEKTGGSPLLPRLTTLQWAHPMEYSAAFPLFLPPMLNDVCLNFSSDLSPVYTAFDPNHDPGDYTVATALRLVHLRAPHIQRLQLHIGSCPGLQFIPTFGNLRHLTFHNVHDPYVVAFACQSLTSIQRLDVTTYYSTKWDSDYFSAPPSQRPHLPDIDLPALRELNLNAPSHKVNLILEALRAPRLTMLAITMELYDEALRACVGTISARYASSLRSLSLNVDDDGDPLDSEADDVRPPLVFADTFSPLFALRALASVSLQLRFETPCVLTADDVRRAAEAWPALRTLYLPFLINGGVPPTYPVTALAHLAARCPDLRAAFVPYPEPTGLQGVADVTALQLQTYDNRLTRLHLLGGSWPPAVRHKCEAYLRRLFPRLKDICMSDTFDDE